MLITVLSRHTNVLVLEPRHADPVSMIHYDKVVLTRPAVTAIAQLWGQA